MQAIRIETDDNVAVVVQDTGVNDAVKVEQGFITALQPIPKGMKIAIEDIEEGAYVIKYGVPIGRALKFLPKGSLVHVDEVADITEALCREYEAEYRARGRG